jgi:hypothetical protein
VAERAERWAGLSAGLRAALAGDYGRLEIRVREALDRGNIYVADELLSAAREALDGSPQRLKALLEAKGGDGPRGLALKDFLESCGSLSRVLENDPNFLETAAGALERGEPPVGLGIGHLPRGRHREAAEAFRAWVGLKKSARKRADAPPEGLEARVGSILRYLGYRPGSGSPLRRSGGRGWELVWVPWPVSSPVAEFGSEASEGVRALVVWERPGVTQLEGIVRDARLGPSDRTLVLYLGRLNEPQRRELREWALRTGFQGLVLDELLLAYLAREYQLRFHTFVRCALPYSAINPYRPTTRGAELPPELFFGREEALSRLLRASHTVFVYGGRQLGKSALLARARHEFHRPEARRYGLLIDVKTVGDPGGLEPDPEVIWYRLARHFPELDTRPPARDARGAAEGLSELFRRDRELRALVMLDEADRFLQADAGRGFVNVSRLNALVTESGGRLRLVFAGLKSVARFRHVPNQPLGGEEVVVGPLDPQAARELVAEPLGWLGYEAGEEAVLTLLAATNFLSSAGREAAAEHGPAREGPAVVGRAAAARPGADGRNPQQVRLDAGDGPVLPGARPDHGHRPADGARRFRPGLFDPGAGRYLGSPG